METMKHYYLINGTVKVSDSKMPELNTYRQTIGSAVYEAKYKRDYGNWLYSLQPCEIDESELDKVKTHLGMSKKIDGYLLPNTEITHIVRVEEIRTETKSGGWTDYKIYFKQPTEKQVESEFVETYDKEWIIDFVIWYSGMNKNSVNKAFQRYIDEVILNNK